MMLKDIATIRGQLAIIIVANGQISISRDHKSWVYRLDWLEDQYITRVSRHEISDGYVDVYSYEEPSKESNEALCRLIEWLVPTDVLTSTKGN